MAWLFVQRAVHEGELAPEDVQDESYRLGARGVCLDDDAARIELLPPHLRTLMARSLKLYQRIARLDEMIGRDRP